MEPEPFYWKALLTFTFMPASMEIQGKFTTDRYVVYKWSGRKFSPLP